MNLWVFRLSYEAGLGDCTAEAKRTRSKEFLRKRVVSGFGYLVFSPPIPGQMGEGFLPGTPLSHTEPVKHKIKA